MEHAPIRAVIFDLDDTLVDHSRAQRAAVSALYSLRPELLTKYPDEAQFQAAWESVKGKHYNAYLMGAISHDEQKVRRARELWQPLVNLTDETAMAIFGHYYELYAQAWKLFPDVQPCLEALFPLKLGVITNGQGAQQRRKLQIDGLAKHFQVVVISGEAGMAKPDARIFQMACAALGVKPHEAMYVGDLYDLDVVGAKGAGLVPVWLRRGAAHLESPGLYAVTSLNELAALVHKHSRTTKNI